MTGKTGSMCGHYGQHTPSARATSNLNISRAGLGDSTDLSRAANSSADGPAVPRAVQRGVKMYHPFDRRLDPKMYHFDRRQNRAKRPVRFFSKNHRRQSRPRTDGAEDLPGPEGGTPVR